MWSHGNMWDCMAATNIRTFYIFILCIQNKPYLRIFEILKIFFLGTSKINLTNTALPLVALAATSSNIFHPHLAFFKLMYIVYIISLNMYTYFKHVEWLNHDFVGYVKELCPLNFDKKIWLVYCV